MVYSDQHHLTFEYAGLMAPVLGAFADRASSHG